MRGFLRDLFRKAPAPVLEWGQLAYHLLPRTWRYGKAFKDALALFRETEDWNYQGLLSYQEQLLEQLLLHCYDNVAYYREVFQELDLKPCDIQSISDLSKLPVLTKEIVRKRHRDLIATNISAVGMESARTSGSSGSPLEFFMDGTTRSVERALALRKLLWLDYRPTDVLAYFKVLPLSNPERFIRYFPGARELRMSFHNSDDERLNQMVEALNRYRPAFIDGWPSCMLVLARWLQRTGKSVPAPRYIATSSENLFPETKNIIEEVFKAPVIDFYGQEESVASAMQCKFAAGYHVQMEVAVLELLPVQKQEAALVVGTCLHNRAMPLIRYRTGDMAIKGDQAPCPCGRKHPTIARFIGREADVVWTPEKQMVSSLVLHYVFYDFDEIKEAQVIQEDLSTLRLLVVPWRKLSEETRKGVINETRNRLQSPGMNLIVETVEEIPATQGGKRPFMISRLSPKDRL